MKKFNKNIIVFIVVSLIIVSGFSKEYLLSLKSSLMDLITGLTSGYVGSIYEFTEQVNKNSTELLPYHNQFMDINSVKENILLNRTIKKDDMTVFKTDTDFLFSAQDYEISEMEMNKVIDKIEGLKTKAEKNNSKFLYLAAPTKAYFLNSPEYINDYSNINYNSFINLMRKNKIPAVDFSKNIMDINLNEAYFYTDHHWTPMSGFQAAKTICKNLNELYGFSYNKNYCDINNFTVDTYKDYFLGSLGKKTGTYFTWKGADDIDIITPKFNTYFIEEQPVKNHIREGEFSKTLMYTENIEQKDYYGKNAYALYSGGDFRLQIMKNKLNANGKKILLIRDSFACVVAPFLALNASELHVVDIRDTEYYVGEKINVYDYIENIKPDYTLVLYSGVSKVDSYGRKYDFN